MAIQCNQYPNLSHNSALPQFLADLNCEDLDPTALQAPSDDICNPKCAHSPMETQCNQSLYPILMNQNCTHNPSTSQVRKSYHSNPVTSPYPPDPGEHVLERSAAPTALVESDKLDPSSLVPPKGEMERSFSWTYLFKSPTSSTLCFSEPTLRMLNKVKLLCNPISNTLCDFTLGKHNQETEFYITKHTPLVHTGTPFSVPKPSSGTNRVSNCQSSLVITSSSRWILDKPNIEVTKALIHHLGKNGYEYPKSWNNIKLNYTSYGCILMEIDWGDKWHRHETHPTGHNTSEVDWGGHDPNPNHMNESLQHDSSVFLFLVNIDYDAKPNESSIQGLWGELHHRTSSIPLFGLQTDSLATGQTGDDIFNYTPFNPDLEDAEQLTGESIQSFLTLVVQLQWLVALGRLVTHVQVTILSKLPSTQRKL